MWTEVALVEVGELEEVVGRLEGVVGRLEPHILLAGLESQELATFRLYSTDFSSLLVNGHKFGIKVNYHNKQTQAILRQWTEKV